MRSKTSFLLGIKDRLLNKYQECKGSLLNQARKETLIKAVLQVIPSYVISIIKFRKTFCRWEDKKFLVEEEQRLTYSLEDLGWSNPKEDGWWVGVQGF